VRLTLFDRTGRQVGVVGEPADYTNPAMSPDGKRVAVGRRDPQTQTRDIWIFDLERGSSSRLTFDPADDFNPAWAGDGATVMFSSMRRPGQRDIYRKLASGTQAEEVVLAGSGQKALDDWSRDGRFIVYDSAAGVTTDLYVVALDGDRKPVAITNTPFNERSGAVSPNGRWIAYASNESGLPAVFVQTFPEPIGRWQVSTSGGVDPMWRGDGRELFFHWQGKMLSVDVAAAGSRFEVSVPRVLFDMPRLAESGRNRYVVSPDGQRFLAVTAIGDPVPLPLTVVLNWPDALRK
jgi:eukaryotic-like serine/threonine-protein kinase